MRKESLHFSIEGEFITDIARQWFWDENRPYEKCHELLSACLQHPDIDDAARDRIIQDIIEGRKKLVGTNTVTVEDDNQRIRPITEKVETLRRKNGIMELERRMQTDPISYIDPYSTVKSVDAFREGITHHKNTMESLREYFAFPENYIGRVMLDTPYPEYNTPTAAGMWLWQEAPLIYDICEEKNCTIDSSVFWEEIYQRTRCRKGFTERNQRYLASLRIAEEKRKWRDAQWNQMCETVDAQQSDNEGNRIRPDDMKEWCGLIAPNGDFYTCGFGGHNSVAYRIITAFEERGDTSLQLTDEEKRMTFFDNGLDTLIRHGWLALRDISPYGHYIQWPENGRITREQKDRIWEAILKFDVHMDIDERLM